MVPVLITIVVVVAVLGVVYLVGSQPSANKKKPASRGGTMSKASRGKGPRPKSAYAQPPTWVRKLPLVFVIAAVVFLVVAVAQFRVEQQQGTPVVAVVLDTSMSMDATDVSPNRLSAAESAAQLFLQQLPSDFEVVLVTFADEPTVIKAATSDHSTVAQALGDLPRGQGTVIGDGLSTAIDQIAVAQAGASGKTPAAIVLLSDGQDTGSKVPPTQAASDAASHGIPVYTVVLGSETGPGRGPNTELLQQIATATGATMSTAGSAGELSNVYESLGAQLSSQLKVSSSAQLFLFVAIALGIGAAVVTIVLSTRKQY